MRLVSVEMMESEDTILGSHRKSTLLLQVASMLGPDISPAAPVGNDALEAAGAANGAEGQEGDDDDDAPLAEGEAVLYVSAEESVEQARTKDSLGHESLGG